MVSQHSSLFEGEGEDDDKGEGMSNPMEKLAELEARMALKDSKHEANIESLQGKIEALENKIGELIVVLEAFKTIGRIAGYAEKSFTFIGKVAVWCGGLYAVYKFGLSELAQKVRDAGGR